jgi:hypothetical protein
LGCLLTLLVLAVVGYYGAGIGAHVFRYVRLLEEMNTQARLARYIDNTIIRDRLVAKVEQLGLPSEARRFTVRRTANPREITVRTSYEVDLELPFTAYTYTFKPEARAPL